MSATPLVSVIVPAYNAARFLPHAVESIRRQDYAPLEIVIVDDGSTDDTAEVVRNLGTDIRYVYQPNAGPAAARNRGLEQARGELIAFLDADDEWPPDKLRIQVGRLLAEPELDVVTGRTHYLSLPGAQDLKIVFESPDRTLSHIHLAAAVFTRRVFERVGSFDVTMRYGEDQDWFLRAREAGVSLLILRDVTLIYRHHSSNMTREKGIRELGVFESLKKSLDRRRKGGGPAKPLRPWLEFDETKRAQPQSAPLISVIIPVYNGARYLAEAIESVLAQSYRPLEILVVDDGSTDGSSEVAGRYPEVRCLRQEHGGAGAARNLGVQQAQGELLAFLDADDLWTPNNLSLQTAALREDPRRDMVFGSVEQFYSPELAPLPEPRRAGGTPSPGFSPGALLIRRESFLRVGLFPTEFRVGEFMDWYARATEAGLVFQQSPDVVLRRRIHNTNLGIRQRHARVDYARVVKAALDRRRQAAGRPKPESSS